MAKIEIIKEETEDSPRSVECLEMLVWGTGGAPGQEFAIGSGSNFDASTNFWIEIRYSIQGLPIFYTRNVVSHAWGILARVNWNISKNSGMTKHKGLALAICFPKPVSPYSAKNLPIKMKMTRNRLHALIPWKFQQIWARFGLIVRPADG